MIRANTMFSTGKVHTDGRPSIHPGKHGWFPTAAPICGPLYLAEADFQRLLRAVASNDPLEVTVPPGAPTEATGSSATFGETAIAEGHDQPTVPTPAVDPSLADWIFARHPRNKERFQTKNLLIANARDAGHHFTTADFDLAYRSVYQSENKRRPLTGWPLNEPYRSKLKAEKSTKSSGKSR